MPDETERAWQCCFCSKLVTDHDSEVLRVTLSKPGSEGSQQWMAHEACVGRAVRPLARFESDIYWTSD